MYWEIAMQIFLEHVFPFFLVFKESFSNYLTYISLILLSYSNVEKLLPCLKIFLLLPVRNLLHFPSCFVKIGGKMKQFCPVWLLKLQLQKQTFKLVIKNSCLRCCCYLAFYSPCYE